MLALVIAAVILPVGLMATHNRSNQLVAVLSQAAYAWLMCFGLMGCFHHFLSRESPVLRYLSDSSYWLYLAHIPLIYVPQFIVRDWSLWAPLKLVVVCVSTTAVLLLSYQWFVRYTVIGTLLNGPRRRSNPNPKDKAIEVVPIEAA